MTTKKRSYQKHNHSQKKTLFLLRAEWDQNPFSQILKILLKALQKRVTAACLCQWFWNEMLSNHIWVFISTHYTWEGGGSTYFWLCSRSRKCLSAVFLLFRMSSVLYRCLWQAITRSGFQSQWHPWLWFCRELCTYTYPHTDKNARMHSDTLSGASKST